MASYEWPIVSGGGGGSGTVTSIGLTVPSFLSVSGSPVTSSGVIAISLSGTALPISSGGTGQLTASAAFNALSPITTAGDLILGNGSNSATRLAIGSNLTVLTSNGTTASWVAPATSGTVTSVAMTVPSFLSVSGTPITSSGTLAVSLSGTALPIANGGTGQTTASAAFNALSPITTTGDLIIGNGSNSATRLGIGSNLTVLTSNGTTASWAAPATSGTVTSVAMSVPAFLSIGGSPITSSGTLAVSLSGTALPIANGGTAVTSVTTAPAATSFAGWDSSKNLSANNLIPGYASTATAGSTTVLSVTSAEQQYFTGSSAQTVTLPVTSTLVTGFTFIIVNNSSGVVTVQSSGANTIQAMAAGTQLVVTCILTSGTTAASWSFTYSSTTQVLAGISPTVQKFTSSSGTYTPPSGVQYIRVRMVGGGGGGAGSGVSGLGAGGNGGSTTFGSLTAGGGSGANGGSGTGGAGGTASGGNISNIIGQQGIGGDTAVASFQAVGGLGGSAPYFVGGGAPIANNAGTAGITNTGGGGSGAGVAGAGGISGGGGGAGGYVESFISAPSTISYVVGVGGTLGSAGVGGLSASAGAAGVIVVEEYYNNLAIGTTAAITKNFVMSGPASGSAASPAFRALVNADLSSAYPTVSQVYLQAPNGHGSSGTTTRRWSTTITNTGSDITYADSATNGGTFTINTTGVYNMWGDDQSASGVAFWGFTKNSASTSTSILSLSASSVISLGQSGGNTAMQQSVTVPLTAADVVRLQDDGSLDYTNNAGRFCIQRII